MKTRFDQNSLKVVRASLAELVQLDTSSPELPSRIRLFKFGANETTKGTFYLAPWCVEACLYAQQQRGVDYPINKNHSYAEAYGWFGVEADAEGIVAGTCPSRPEMDGIWWLDTQAVDEVKKGQWRYTSAEFWLMPEWIEDEEGYVVDVRWWIVEIVGLALTNYPATYNAQPVVLSDIAANAPYFAQLSAISPLEFHMPGTDDKAPKNNPAPPSVTSAPKASQLTAGPIPGPSQEQLVGLWALCQSLTSKKDPVQVAASLRAMAYSHEQLPEVVQELNTLKTQTQENAKAEAENEGVLAVAEKKRKAAELVDQAIAEFKVKPAKRDHFLSLAGENGERLAELEETLKELHPIVGAASVQVSTTQSSASSSQASASATVKTVQPRAPVVLSAFEKKVAKDMGLTEEQYAASKAETN